MPSPDVLNSIDSECKSEPKYSVLYNGYDLKSEYNIISGLLYRGIKVIWFGKEPECMKLVSDFPGFTDMYLLQTYSNYLSVKFRIVDGDYGQNLKYLEELSSKNHKFNCEQYLVEHCRAHSNIIVRASAGTGKTSVMIDRVMFLRHTVPDLSLAEIVMITFTNDAANEIGKRMLHILGRRFELTHNKIYLTMLEEQSQMRISTIHSFELELIKKFGTSKGLSDKVTLESFSNELNNIVNRALNKIVCEGKSVESQIGGTYYDVRKSAIDFWRKFVQKGYNKEQIQKMDWGDVAEGGRFVFQNAVKYVVNEICDEFDKSKQNRDAVSLDDIQCDLDLILQDQPDTDIGLKYIFIDEFQDTDLSQISILCKIASWNSNIFVVGDVKQSIYRFRGANEHAFDIFKHSMERLGMEAPTEFILVKNYRTAAPTLERMNSMFLYMGGNITYQDQHLFDYTLPIRAVRVKDIGNMIVHPYYNAKEELNEEIVRTVRSALDDFQRRHADRNNNGEWKSSECVVALVRTNKQLSYISEICQDANINVVLRKEGNFYQCDAVKDFTAMIGSFVFNRDPVHLYNYLIGPYSGVHSPVRIEEMEVFDGNREKVLRYLMSIVSETNWEKYSQQFRMRPFLYVIEKMLKQVPILDIYQRIDWVKRHSQHNWDDEGLRVAVHNDTVQYRADLEKLLTVIKENANVEFANLYGLYNYLKLQTATNTEEPQAKPEGEIKENCLYCMTVHASKGLEFDTVILPYTTSPPHHQMDLRSKDGDIIYVDDQTMRVGWKHKKGNTITQNDNFNDLDMNELVKDTAESARLLYVAMTRAVNNLHILVKKNRPFRDTWSHWFNMWGEF